MSKFDCAEELNLESKRRETSFTFLVRHYIYIYVYGISNGVKHVLIQGYCGTKNSPECPFEPWGPTGPGGPGGPGSAIV